MAQVRYVKQRDKYSCGPVAVMNVLKWVGVEFNYQERIDVMRRVCECRPPNGTKHAAFDRALRITAELLPVDLRVRLVYKPKLGQIEEHLRAGGIIVLNYRWRRGGEGARHFMLVTKISDTGRSFLVVNDHRSGRAARRITRTKFKNWNLRYQRTDQSYKAWFIHVEE